MNPLRVVTLAGDAEREARIAEALTALSDVELLLRCMDRIELLGALRGGGLDAVISVGSPGWFDAPSAEEIRRTGVRLVGVVADPLEADALAALGASLVPPAATTDEVIQRCRTEPPPDQIALPPQPPSDGRLITVWGPKGSPGRTTLAIELASALAASEPATLLLDGDPYGGDVVQALGVVEEIPGIVWAARQAARDKLSPMTLFTDLRRAGRKGPVILPGLPRPELWEDVSGYAWERLLEGVRSVFRQTVCDTGFSLEAAPPGTPDGGARNRMTRAAVSNADRVVAVLRADPVGIKSFLWAYESLLRLAEPEKVFVVANRVEKGREREIAEVVKRHTGARPVAYLPLEPDDLRAAVEQGRSVHELKPRSDLVAATRSLTARLGGSVPNKGLLARLAGRS